MDSPRKKIKTSLPASEAHVGRVPESPPTIKTHNTSIRHDAKQRDSSLALPHRPNLALRKGALPIQSTYPVNPNGPRAAQSVQNNISHAQQAGQSFKGHQNTDSAQKLRRHVAGYEYMPSYPSESQTHQTVPNHTSTGSSALQHQSAQHFYPDYSAPNRLSNGASMADQYSAAARPQAHMLQRIPSHENQRPRPHSNGSTVPYAGTEHYDHQKMGYHGQRYSDPAHIAATGPMQANGNAYHLPIVDNNVLAKLTEVFPHLPDALLRKALMQARGNIHDAQALIADDRVKFDPNPATGIPGHSGMTSHLTNPYAEYRPNPYAPPMYGHNATASSVLPASTKREIKAPNLSIRQKQALRTAQTYAGPHPGQIQGYQQHNAQYPYPGQFHSGMQQYYGPRPQIGHAVLQKHKQAAVYEAPKLRTRAVKKGPKIEIDSEESDADVAVELESDGPEESDGDSEEEDSVDDVVVVPIDLDRIGLEARVLQHFNSASTSRELADLAGCSDEIAQFILDKRPHTDLEAIRELDQLPKGKRPSKTRKTIGMKAVETALDALEGYEAIDSLIVKCEDYGRGIKDCIAQWGVKIDSTSGNQGALEVTKVQTKSASPNTDIAYIDGQPSLLPDNVRLKEYQLFGVNWLHLLYQKKLSGILADEMGLGKTCQVISFLGVLLARNLPGPHLIVVPASTLENWLREISRFCPALKVEAYYGSQKERNEFRDQFEGEKRTFNVMVTTYQLAAGAKEDRVFLKKQAFDVCVYDEGHNLKNSSSFRYQHLMALKANFRVLLTGTPLQNNLKELISLLSFILPKVFVGNMERLNSIFKIKAFADSESLESALLSQQRITRAKTMMTPFVLRRYKKDVLMDMPQKKYRVDYLELNQAQKEIYDDYLESTRKSLLSKSDVALLHGKDMKSAANIMMQLRKCSNHPMLFRKKYNDVLLKEMAKNILKEETFKDSNLALVIEDMEVMTDFELNRLCLRYPKIQRFALKQDCWMDACKVEHLRKIIPEMKTNGDRILLFSQFTQTLDILEDCLDTMGVTYFRLDGSTDVSARQDLIDQFHEETDITVFLLSTKAGGFGINLACANVVIIYDSSFNPHDDKQAEDRAHRVGQTKEVQIIRLVTRNTIEEHIARLANTKLALDSSVSSEEKSQESLAEEQGERSVAQALMSQLTDRANV